jgi:GMP synthase (glutamine-hydrolysing)
VVRNKGFNEKSALFPMEDEIRHNLPMRKVLVFQHVAHEILGTLTPLLKARGFRIRFVNFDRSPEEAPSLEKYNGLIVLGGWMGVYESDRYPHIQVECKLIEEALKRDLPVLGICFGSQLLAHTLGSEVRLHTQKEIGWHPVHFSKAGLADPLFSHCKSTETLFQMHGDTFDIPKSAVQLAHADACAAQAFRYGNKAYGLQFHLETDRRMIDRFLQNPESREDVEKFAGLEALAQIEADTEKHIARSVKLSTECFRKFLNFFGVPERHNRGHGKDEV